MQVNAYSDTSSTGTSSSSTSSGTSADELSSTFITLLTTELKCQDPTNPVDATQFVSQLVDLNSLTQLMDIDSLVDGISETVGSATTSTT